MPHAIREGDIPGVQLRCDASFPLSPEDLWRWLTEPSRLERWAAGTVELEEDGALLLHVRGEGDSRFSERIRTVAREEAMLWVLALERLGEGWESATKLSFDLSESDGGCRLSVRQQGFERLSLSRCLTVWELYRRRWRSALDRLAAEIADTSA